MDQKKELNEQELESVSGGRIVESLDRVIKLPLERPSVLPQALEKPVTPTIGPVAGPAGNNASSAERRPQLGLAGLAEGADAATED